MSLSRVGVNLPPLADYYSGARVYIDMVRTSPPPGSFEKIDVGDPGPLDENGWPTGDHGLHLTPYGAGMRGTLKVFATGKLEALIVRVSRDRGTNFRYDATTNTTTADLPITSEAVGVSLQVRGRGLGPIQILRPGYADAKQVFTNELLDLIRHFGFIRFMDAFGTNTTANSIVTWDDRPRISDSTYVRRGMPWEHAIDLANATNARPWLNLPYTADEDCARRFAELVKSRLKPGLIPIFECDNEGWGTHFKQGQLNAAAAQVEQETDPALRANPWNQAGDWNTWRWCRLMKRVVWFNDILMGIFGSRDAYRILINTQAVRPAVFEIMLGYLKAIGRKPADVIHAVAIAPYADLHADLRDDPNLTHDRAFAPGGIDVGATANDWTKRHVELAKQAGVRCWVYEGGINCYNKNPGIKVPAVKTMQSDPRMGEAVEAYLDNWDFNGGLFPDDRLFGFFNVQSQWRDNGTAANFGATDDVAKTDGPKLRALLAAAERYTMPQRQSSRDVSKVIVCFSDGSRVETTPTDGGDGGAT